MQEDSMTNKIVIFDAETRNQLLKGVNILADAVKVTMGPRGRNVIIEQPGKHPILTKDGVTVARSINLKDRVANLGAQMIKEAASRTAEEAGDGTTTSTVLAQSIYLEGLKLLAAGYSASDLKRGIDQSVDSVLAEIKSMSITVDTDEMLTRVAIVSANGEKELGELISLAIKTVGADGVVSVEEAKGLTSSLSVVAGARVERGYLSPYFVTNQDKMICEFEKPLIVILNTRLDSLRDISTFLEKVLTSKRPLLLFCDDVEGEALQGLVVNKLKGILNVCAVKIPGLGEDRFEIAQDLACLLQTEVFNLSDVSKLNSVALDKFGTCSKVLVSRSETIIINAKGTQESYSERIDEIKQRLESATNELEKNYFKKRLSMLWGGVALLRVGGATEAELKERSDRADDALHATQAAMKDGIVPGGGIALARAASKIVINESDSAAAAGRQIIRSACYAPLKQIVANSGGVPDIVLAKVLEADSKIGYDAFKETYGDMLLMGIIDPTRVVSCALINAASAASMMLTAGCSIILDESNDNDN